MLNLLFGRLTYIFLSVIILFGYIRPMDVYVVLISFLGEGLGGVLVVDLNLNMSGADQDF